MTLLTTKNDLVIKRPPFANSRSGSSRQTPLQATPGSPETAPSPPRHFSTPRDVPLRKEMPHRATFLANDGVFDHKRAGAGQTTAICKNSFRSTWAGQPQSRQPVGSVDWSVWSDKFVSPGRTARQPGQTARRPRANGSSAFNLDRTVRQLGSNSLSAQINQFLIYALRTLTSIGARTAHAIKFIGKQTKRRKAHGERYHERHKQNRELHGRPLSANAKAPNVCSPREFRERIKPLSTSTGKSNSLESSCRMSVKPTQSAGQK